MNPEVSQNLSWWQVGAGIVPILAALVGIIYTWFLIQKANLEARKLRLEIVEKESATSATLALKPLVAVEEFSLSNLQRVFLVAFVIFNLTIMLATGLKMRPLYGVEVLSVVLGAVFCAGALGGYIVLRMLHVTRVLMSIDNEVINTMAKALRVLNGKQEESTE